MSINLLENLPEPSYICSRCSRIFYLKTNWRSHYFCTLRTRQECDIDQEIIAQTTKPLSLFHKDYANMLKRREWAEEIKKQIIYEQEEKLPTEFKIAQTITLIEDFILERENDFGLFKRYEYLFTEEQKIKKCCRMQMQHYYAFNECCFLVQNLQQDPEELLKMIEKILHFAQKFLLPVKSNPPFHSVQYRILLGQVTEKIKDPSITISQTLKYTQLASKFYEILSFDSVPVKSSKEKQPFNYYTDLTVQISE